MSEKNRESLKGKWNKIGAPPKKVHWPYGKFTREQLFARNPDQCELTLIIKVKKAVGVLVVVVLIILSYLYK